MTNEREKDGFEIAMALAWRGGAVAVVLIAAMMGCCPVYNVWTAKMEGEAAIARQTREGQAALAAAQSTRMVLVTQAEAEREAATKRAEAIAIVGKAAKDFPEYRQQEFIGAFSEALQHGKIAQIVYVPTEANIPIIEARRAKP